MDICSSIFLFFFVAPIEQVWIVSSERNVIISHIASAPWRCSLFSFYIEQNARLRQKCFLLWTSSVLFDDSRKPSCTFHNLFIYFDWQCLLLLTVYCFIFHLAKYISKANGNLSSAEFTSLHRLMTLFAGFGHRFNCFTFLIHSLGCFSFILSSSLDSFVGWLLLFYVFHCIQPKQTWLMLTVQQINQVFIKAKKINRLVSTAMDPFQCSIWF